MDEVLLIPCNHRSIHPADCPTSINIFLWAVVLCSHAACTSFGGLFAVRFLLGICEGAITPGFMIVTSMFYTRAEQTRRVGYWCQSPLLSSVRLVSFSPFSPYERLRRHHPWLRCLWRPSYRYPNLHALAVVSATTLVIQHFIHSNQADDHHWYHNPAHLGSLLVSISSTSSLTSTYLPTPRLFFPDSPTNAWFLTPEERIAAVQRIQVNQAGVENKSFKIEQ